MSRRLLAAAAALLVSAIALWFLLTPAIIAEMRLLAETANTAMLAAAILIVALVQWLRAWRFAMMTRGSTALPPAGFVRISFQLNFLNFTLPFRIGELGYPILMQRGYGEPLMRSAGILLLARLFDLVTVGAILAATAAFYGIVPRLTPLFWLAAACLAAAPFAMMLAAPKVRPLLLRLPVIRSATAAEDTAEHLPLAARVAAILLSFAIWLIFGAAAALAVAAVSNATAPGVALLGAAASNLAFALPINGIGGFGPAQAAWVAVVTKAGVSFQDAVIGALAVYAVTLASAILFGGLAMATGGGGRSR